MMSKHVLIKEASQEDLDIASEAALWLSGAVATATQDRQLMLSNPAANKVLIDAIEGNGVLACLRAMKAKDKGDQR